MMFTNLPLNIDVTEVPKYTVFLGKFHNKYLGMLSGLMLEAWSANTCRKMGIYIFNKINYNMEI